MTTGAVASARQGASGAKHLQLRLFVMMALQLAIWGAWAPKLFPYMTMLGFSATEQALVGSCWGLASILGIFFTNEFADRRFAAEKVLAVSHLLGGACLLGGAFTTSFLPFFLFFLGFSIVYVPTLSVTNTVCFANLRDPAGQFGKIRMGGTVGWVVVSWPMVFLLGAHAGSGEVRWILIVAALVSFTMAAYSLSLPHTPPRSGEGQEPLAWRKALRLLRKPVILTLFLVTFLDSVVHNGYFVMSDAFLTNRVGIAQNLSMVVLSLGQIAEMVTMIILGAVLAKLGWRATMIVGILGHAARFAIFAFAPDSVPLIVAVQLLHGICYAFFFATVYIFVDDAFPKDVRVSAQGLFNLLIVGLGNVAASFLFPMLMSRMTETVATPGGLVERVDYTSLFMVPTGLALLGALLLAVAFRPATRGPTKAPPPAYQPEDVLPVT